MRARPKVESEKVVEAYLRDQVKAIGGCAYKFTSPSRRSVPDRILVIPYLPPFFVECKTTGQKPTDAQQREIGRLRRMRQEVIVIDHRDKVDLLINIKREEMADAKRSHEHHQNISGGFGS